MKMIQNKTPDEITTHIIETLGKSNIPGSYLRYYNEVKNRHIKIASLRLKLIEQGKYTNKNARVIIKHQTIINKYLNRLAQSILHNTTHPDQKGWNVYYRANPLNLVYQTVSYVPPPRNQSTVSRVMRQSSYKQAQTFYSQKIAFEIQTANEKGWFMVFDTLKFADEKLAQFYKDSNHPNALERPINKYLGNYAKSISNQLGYKRKDKINRTEYYRYFCVPEYGGETNRLHFHILHLMKVLPRGCSTDPNSDNPSHTYREVQGMKYNWNYSAQTTPIAVRYAGDAFKAKLDWLFPKQETSKGLIPVKISDSKGLAVYMSKYVAKGVDTLESQGDKWNLGMRRKGFDARTIHRITVSKGFGFNDIAPMDNLSIETIIELTKLSHDSTPWHSLLKHSAKRHLKTRLDKTLSIEKINSLAPVAFDFVSVMKSKLGKTPALITLPVRFKKIPFESLSQQTINYLETNNYARHQQPQKPNTFFAGK